MTWLQRYRLSYYFRTSIWILPVLGMFAALAVASFLHHIDTTANLTAKADPASGLALLGNLASSMFTFLVFVCSVLLVAVQLGSAQLTPRIVGLVLANRITKLSLTLFAFTFTFTLAALVRVKAGVPLLTGYAAAYSCLASLVVFFYLIDMVTKALRPSGALTLVAHSGRDVVKSVYPRPLSQFRNDARASLPNLGEPRCTIPNLNEGVVLAFDMNGLVTLAERWDCVIEMVPQVGDFVGADQPLFRIFAKGELPPARALHHSVALGPERTLQQDPSFAFRIMVDIASKALSPAINDPTTAVLALDQIEYLLRQIGVRALDEGQRRDADGVVRLLYRTPDWEDFVFLAATELRHFGGGSIQVARRLRALLENLIRYLPEQRAPVLRQELDLLHRCAHRFFSEAEDQALADISDAQGVGGATAISGNS